MKPLQFCLFVSLLAIASSHLGNCQDDPQQVSPLEQVDLEQLEKLETPSSSGALRDLLRNLRPHFKVPKIFEWRVFKERYHKSYKSAVEDLRRMKNFLARSCDVIIKAVKYYNRQISYFTTITDKSDLFLDELKASRNKVLAGDEIEREAHDEVRKLVRLKRESAKSEDGGDSGQEERGSEIKERYSKQDGFKMLKVLFTEAGARRNYSELPVKSQYKTNGLGHVLGLPTFGDWTPSELKQQVHRGPAEGDVVWVDHRRSGCFQPVVGSQGQCGSCYAFAMMAFFEWAHCKETGELVKFSEQYLMDCGRMTSDSIVGCSGAKPLACGEFVSNFGLELARTYPYRAKSSVCPYESQTPIDAMGHLKVGHLDEIVRVDLEVAGDYLEFAPMLISIQSEGDFDFYGGGVFDGRECRRRRRGDHAVLLIGHGREDGEEYWLIRNSYGMNWGEEGHMKINKNSRCIWPAEGVVFGSLDGKLVKLGVVVNEKMSQPFNMIKSPLAFALRTVPIG